VIWSISESRTFRRCQRQWYYKNVLASPKAKEPSRREAYLLSKLQSLSAWRGQVVDSVISDQIVPAIRTGRRYTLGEAKKAALNLFDRQLQIARQHPLRDASFCASKDGSKMVVLHCMEYDGEIPEDEMARARKEIADAFDNLVKMRDLFGLLSSAQRLIAQRSLMFKHSGATIRAVPDLIAFYKDEPPLIVDWKVHVFGVREAWLQLAVYAQALLKCKPHVDFPETLGRWTATDVRLVEAQLLTKAVRQYSLSSEELDRSEAYMAESVTDILLAIADRDKVALTASDFPVTLSPDACQRCPFRKICWREEG
jgi:PD-(D/E)XK nuclease superfamily